LGLVLADGQRWIIRALDQEAAATLQELGKVMRLDPAQGGRELRVSSSRNCARARRESANGPLTCRLGPARNRRTEVLRMERIAAAIAAQSLARGGLLMHGALAVHDGAGFILAGPSGVGKSTACRRLPSPWVSLSDDNVLVVRDATGRYWAHPWPTWSILRDNGPAESWPVEQAAPLKALLFLDQSPVDRAEPVAVTHAAALVMESVVGLARTVALTPDSDANRAICEKHLRVAWGISAAVPAFRLYLSLTGQFWREIERVITRGRPATEEGMSNLEPGIGDCRFQISDSRSQIPPRPPSPVSRPPARSLRPKLIRFQARNRTFLKLVAAGRVVGSANDILTEWHIRRPFRMFIDERSLESPPLHEWQQRPRVFDIPSEN
jgi:SynChlorMet cassette protein ScmC